MKLNWGSGIFLFLLFFVLSGVGFLLYTITIDWSLVEDDYYPKGLKHEQVLVKERNYSSLQEPLTVQLSAASVDIRFPSIFRGQSIAGHIQAYRPSDKALDYHTPVKVDTTLVQSIPLSHFRRGNYVIKIDWYASGKAYYKEDQLFIP